MAYVFLDQNGDPIYDDPTKNYEGGTPNFDEGAAARPSTPPPPSAPGLKTEQDFKNALGGLYDPATYQSYLANTSNNGGGDPNDWFNRIVAKESLRGSNEANSTYQQNGQGGYTVGPTGKVNMPNPAITAAQSAGTKTPTQFNYPPNQFSDPYTSMLESIAKSQMNQYQQPMNQAPWDQFSQFINQRFNELSHNPGYSPQELALLRTQASEPIEQYRSASKQRALQHAAQAGFLPSSGITDLSPAPNGGLQPIDYAFDQMRAASDRDLAINALNRRNQDLNSALNLGQLGVQLPEQQFGAQQQRNNAALQLATLLQQLPAQAQAEALAVINGTGSPASLLPYVNQIAQQNQQRNYNLWGSLGQLAAVLGL